MLRPFPVIDACSPLIRALSDRLKIDHTQSVGMSFLFDTSPLSARKGCPGLASCDSIAAHRVKFALCMDGVCVLAVLRACFAHRWKPRPLARGMPRPTSYGTNSARVSQWLARGVWMNQR